MKNVFYNSPVARLLLCLSPCDTIMLFGLVFSEVTEDRMKQATRNHECVHARQWCETSMASGTVILALVLSLGITPWWMLFAGAVYYVWYVIEWAVRLVLMSVMKVKDASDGCTPYEAVSFEREARLSERDSDYLENNGYFGWLCYI